MGRATRACAACFAAALAACNALVGNDDVTLVAAGADGGPDAAPADGAPRDGSPGDAAAVDGAGGDATPPDAGPTGTFLYAAVGANVLGVTSDGFAAVVDSGHTFAVSLSSGQRVDVAAKRLAPVLVTGDAIVGWDAQTAHILVWSSATGAHEGTIATAPGLAGVHGGRVFYVRPSNPPTSGDLMGGPADNPDLDTVIVGGIALPGAYDPCEPRFVQRTATLFVSTCAGGAASLIGLLQNGTSTTIAQNVGPYWSVDANGADIFVVDAPTATGEVVRNDGTVVTMVDEPVEDGFILPDASAVVYTSGGALKRYSMGTLQRSTLVPSGARGLWRRGAAEALAPDFGHVLFRAGAPNLMTGTSDVWLGGATMAGAAAQLSTSATARALGFSASSAMAAWIQDPGTPSGSSLEVADFWAAQTATAGSAKKLASASAVQAATSTGFAYNEGYTSAGAPLGTADLRHASAAALAPVLVAPRANALFAVTPDHAHIVYGTDAAPPGAQGIYVAPVP